MENTDNKKLLPKQFSSGRVNNFLLFIVTCGFVGYLPGAPGTYASILGCFILYFFPFSSFFINMIFLCCLIPVSILCINILEYHDDDPSYIVIDELAGMSVTMAGHEANLLNIITGFILFRFFDIIKCYPVKQVERFKKGYGVVADDVLAGIFANMVICLGYAILKK